MIQRLKHRDATELLSKLHQFLSPIITFYVISAKKRADKISLPVRVEVVAGLVSQRGVKVEAAFVDEKLDKPAERTKRQEQKNVRYTLREWNTMRR